MDFDLAQKSLDVRVVWAQLRRIACEHCSAPFVYLATGTASAKSVGLPIVTSDASMRREVDTDMKESLGKQAYRPRLGEGRCPHCSRYQRWMVARSRRDRAKTGLVVGITLGLVGALVYAATRATWTTDPTAYLVGLGVGASLGPLVGVLFASRVGPYTRPDRRSCTDEALQARMARWQAEGKDPALAWWLEAGGRMKPDLTVVGLPPHDATQRVSR